MDGEVTVQIKNPPAGATKWQISVIDWDVTEIQSWGTKEQDNIGESASFDIPPRVEGSSPYNSSHLSENKWLAATLQSTII